MANDCENRCSTDIRSSWINPFGTGLIPVQYSVVEGHAVLEGCIILGTPQQLSAAAAAVQSNPGLIANPNYDVLGVGIKDPHYRWPDRKVYYNIDPNLPNPARVLQALDHWRARQKTLEFIERTDQADYIWFTPGSGCASYVGRQGKAQPLTLGGSCSVGNVIHEIGHAVGLWHEQSRSDRDEHMKVHWNNIRPEAIHNFQQHINDGVDLGAYDTDSIMHYPKDAFAKAPNLLTIEARTPGVVIGQRKALSDGDVAAVAALYQGV